MSRSTERHLSASLEPRIFCAKTFINRWSAEMYILINAVSKM